MARKTKTSAAATFDVDAVIRASHGSDVVTPWMCTDSGTIASAILRGHPRPGDIAVPEVEEFVLAVSRGHARGTGQTVKVGGEELRVYNREVSTPWGSHHHSPIVPGVFLDGEVPDEPGIVERATAALERALRSPKLPKDMLIEIRRYTPHREHGFPSYEVVLRRYDVPGSYKMNASFGHRTPAEFEGEIARIALHAKQRWKHRFELLGCALGAEAWALHKIEGVDGVTYVSAEVSYVAFDGDRIHSATTRCHFKALGDELVEHDVTVSGHDDERFAALAARHRRAANKLKGKSHADAALTIHPLVAAAVRGRMADHGADMLDEIEAVVVPGRRRHASQADIRRRGISTFAVQNGEVVAPVTLAKGMKFAKDRIWITKVKSLPATVIDALPGKPLSAVIDHPWLEGLTVRTVLVDKRGISMRPDYEPQPLQPLLDELRRRFSDRKSAP